MSSCSDQVFVEATHDLRIHLCGDRTAATRPALPGFSEGTAHAMGFVCTR